MTPEQSSKIARIRLPHNFAILKSHIEQEALKRSDVTRITLEIEELVAQRKLAMISLARQLSHHSYDFLRIETSDEDNRIIGISGVSCVCNIGMPLSDEYFRSRKASVARQFDEQIELKLVARNAAEKKISYQRFNLLCRLGLDRVASYEFLEEVYDAFLNEMIEWLDAEERPAATAPTSP